MCGRWSVIVVIVVYGPGDHTILIVVIVAVIAFVFLIFSVLFLYLPTSTNADRSAQINFFHCLDILPTQIDLTFRPNRFGFICSCVYHNVCMRNKTNQ